jgi:hypothetical protein
MLALEAPILIEQQKGEEPNVRPNRLWWAEAVLAGTKSLDEAYHEVKLATGKINNEAIRLRKLRDTRPDLAERVELNETKLDEARNSDDMTATPYS